jgi:hypothetical protein
MADPVPEAEDSRFGHFKFSEAQLAVCCCIFARREAAKEANVEDTACISCAPVSISFKANPFLIFT